jgi:hypothetical protein
MEGAGRLATFSFRWPGEIPGWGHDNFFAGAWFPPGSARVEVIGLPSSVAQVRGDNWVIVSARSAVHEGRPGLAHVRGEDAVAFRGYIFPRLHSYSASSEISAYWLGAGQPPHNGIFAAAIIGDGGRSCTLVSDFLGMAPLFFRGLRGGVLFATNPRYLVMEGDSPDWLGRRHFMHVGYLQANRTLTDGVEAVPAGGLVRFGERGMQRRQWFDLASLPPGDVEAGPRDLAELEELFREALARSLALGAGATVLQLSAGFDSRRILGALLEAGANFRAITSRMAENSRGNIDAEIAKLMAASLGLEHRLVEAESLESYTEDERIRWALLNGHCLEHAWAVQVMRESAAEPTLLLEGDAGDVLGRPVGWRNHAQEALEPGVPENERPDVIAAHVATGLLDRVLEPGSWPSLQELRADLCDYFMRFAPRNNLSEITFLLQRTRRGIVFGGQQLAPPGCVPVYPYLDLDYTRSILRYTPASKVALWIQRASLREFYPRLYRFPSTRDYPLERLPHYVRWEREQVSTWLCRLRNDITSAGYSVKDVATLLRPPRRLLLRLAWSNAAVAQRAGWYLVPLFELLTRQATSVSCWSLVGYN